METTSLEKDKFSGLSVVIACSRPQYIERIVQSFANRPSELSLEIIFVGEVPDQAKASEDVLFIREEKKHPNGKRNKGIERAKYSHIALLDDDAFVKPEWLENVSSLVKSEPDVMWTGPEQPSTKDKFSQKLWRAHKSFVFEFSFSHIQSKSTEISWYDVPFCNCIFPKRLWQSYGPMSEQIPWHMDDFHFLYPLKNRVSFKNSSSLEVFHDRYPTSMVDFLKYKLRLRFYTGWKVVSFPIIYNSVLSVAAMTLATLCLLAIAFINIKLFVEMFLLVFVLDFFVCLLLNRKYFILSMVNHWATALGFFAGFILGPIFFLRWRVLS